ncbi:MAG: 16S rRNA (uracil(1498)-N(3))-methyltransferase [Proteobacteria bacterium]|nr:MAG: 16S rRNA (uracil(1498)-N(3))-methyltransferase [Pseudomonadota bacterium]
MRIPRFYLPISLQTGLILDAPAKLLHHAVQVLRLQEGEPLSVFNGTGGEYLAHLQAITKRSAQLLIGEFQADNKESKLDLTLVLAMIKPDKMDLALQKAVELGIKAFQPLITQRSVIRLAKDKQEKKQQHWEAIAISACEQCGRNQLPLIHKPLTLQDYLIQSSHTPRLILTPNESSTLKQQARTFQQNPQSIKRLHLLIGPEGGFHKDELDECLQAGVQPISLGSRILRAETAAIASLSLAQACWGDL